MNDQRNKVLHKIKENKYVKKTKKGMGSLVFSRAGLFAFLILLQIFLLVMINRKLGINQYYLFGGSSILSFIMMMVILNLDQMNPYMKLSWLIFIFVAPTFAIVAFLMSYFKIGYRREHKRVIDLEKESRIYHSRYMSRGDISEIGDKRFENLSYYLKHTGGFSTYKSSTSEYYKLGDDMYLAMIEDIKNAKDFIFMEFFILDYGYMWGTILELLVEKV
ncbi:PLDc N-terminal domain-containing protein, partial [uncultured Anaerococcus sp.]|uniref:PLDc N-terminal domain-containing protein n=1 Tax=uncultured Anaerococcus sp. TaxID=293428 RepID=UPI00345C2C1E